MRVETRLWQCALRTAIVSAREGEPASSGEIFPSPVLRPTRLSLARKVTQKTTVTEKERAQMSRLRGKHLLLGHIPPSLVHRVQWMTVLEPSPVSTLLVSLSAMRKSPSLPAPAKPSIVYSSAGCLLCLPDCITTRLTGR